MSIANALRMKISNLQREIYLVQASSLKEEEKEKLELQFLKQLSNQETNACLIKKFNIAISDLNSLIIDEKRNLLELQYLFESRQVCLLHQLSKVYPISKNISDSENHMYTIRGIELNENFSYRGGCEDKTETGLGYLVHLLQLISKYLEIPLRYQILYYSSRSMIRDCIAIPTITSFPNTFSPFLNGVVLPLYIRGVEYERFENAISWLKYNIQQVMTNRHIAYNDKETMLGNMYRYFESILEDG